MNFPGSLNASSPLPNDSLAPARSALSLLPKQLKSSFWGGEGDGIVVYVVVHGFNARVFRGILAPNTGGVGSHQTVKRFQT